MSRLGKILCEGESRKALPQSRMILAAATPYPALAAPVAVSLPGTLI